jgi:hypothetical protein
LAKVRAKIRSCESLPVDMLIDRLVGDMPRLLLWPFQTNPARDLLRREVLLEEALHACHELLIRTLRARLGESPPGTGHTMGKMPYVASEHRIQKDLSMDRRRILVQGSSDLGLPHIGRQ